MKSKYLEDIGQEGYILFGWLISACDSDSMTGETEILPSFSLFHLLKNNIIFNPFNRLTRCQKQYVIQVLHDIFIYYFGVVLIELNIIPWQLD